MSDQISIGKVLTGEKAGEDAIIDIPKLMGTRAIIQAGSGGGKSYAIRKIVEKLYGHVQVIILDPEGEFSTLREKFDFVLFGKDGDYPTSLKTADVMARKLLELQASAVIDLYELEPEDRERFVHIFLDAMINAPKSLWHYCVVILDESHEFCPQNGKSDSAKSVKSIMTKGRKRGWCPILATQRISSLDKNAVAQAQNKLIGLTTFKGDRDRAAEELGFSGKDENLGLRDLDPGEFYAFGPAISRGVEKIKIGQVETTHVSASSSPSQRSISRRSSEQIRDQLSKLGDLPQAAERELKEKADYEQEIGRLKRELASNKIPQRVVQGATPEDVKAARDSGFQAGKREGQLESKIFSDKLSTVAANYRNTLLHLAKDAQASAATDLPVLTVAPSPMVRPEPPAYKEMREKAIKTLDKFEDPEPLLLNGEANLPRGARSMLWIVDRFQEIDLDTLSVLSLMNPTGGSFDTYLRALKAKGYVRKSDDKAQILPEGASRAVEISQVDISPSSLISAWKNKLVGGQKRMLEVLANVYPDGMSKEALGEQSSIALTGGSFDTYLRALKANRLIEVKNDLVYLSKRLYAGEGY